MIVVVAGGIGSGKSTVMNILNGLGASVVYADVVNRELLNDNNYIQLIDSNFNGVVINGRINKKALRNLIFNDENARLKLNSIAHPLIFDLIDKKTRSLGLVFVEIPLFAECSKYIKYDKLCAVKAPIEDRIRRISSRDNISFQDAKKIIESQIKEEKIFEKADFIIYNDTDFESLQQQVLMVYDNVR